MNAGGGGDDEIVGIGGNAAAVRGGSSARLASGACAAAATTSSRPIGPLSPNAGGGCFDATTAAHPVFGAPGCGSGGATPPAAVASIQFTPKWLDVLGGTDPSLLRHLKIRSSARPLTQVRSR